MADRGEWDCIGVARDTYKAQQQEREERPKQQPWLVRKLVVGVVIGIVGWTYYVYVGRMCVELIRRREKVKGGVWIGIFNLLFLMFCWTYIKVILTPPGYARDHVPTCEPPASTRRPWEVDSEIRGTEDGHETIASRYEEMSERGHGVGSAPATMRSADIEAQMPAARKAETEAAGERDDDVREVDAVPGVADVRARVAGGSGAVNTEKGKKDGKGKKTRPQHVDRIPPQTPVLAEEYRYCARDKLMKPMRTHHCRLCATCVLQYDHHCPWIGQCVGAGNRKFFVNFSFWSTWFTAWVFATLLAQVVIDSAGENAELDGQKVAIIAISGVFTLFTGSLTVGHVRLLCINATTVESLGFSRTREKDRALLGMMFGFWEFRKRTQQKKQWSAEWGRIEREGNLWWLEGWRRNWEQVMGESKWEWFLPIGRSLNDGMYYPLNPRHDPDGRWRPRSQWPEELR
ncbi:zf-DHHC-domain-containing protein [Ceratobasidium sp. AG-I]|nr:zf-DHHC-domain-containing protein [Ceratobasidium sp. AG-I]